MPKLVDVFQGLSIATLLLNACQPSRAPESPETALDRSGSAETCDNAYLTISDHLVEVGEPGQYGATKRGIRLDITIQNQLEGCAYFGQVRITDPTGNTKLIFFDETNSEYTPTTTCSGSPKSSTIEFRRDSLKYLGELAESACFAQTSPHNFQYNLGASTADLILYPGPKQYILDIVTKEQHPALGEDHIVFHDRLIPLSDFLASLRNLHFEDGIPDVKVLYATHQINPDLAQQFVPTPTPTPPPIPTPTVIYREPETGGDSVLQGRSTDRQLDEVIVPQPEQPSLSQITITINVTKEDGVSLFTGTNPTGKDTLRLLQLLKSIPDQNALITQLNRLGISAEGLPSRILYNAFNDNVKVEAKRELIQGPITLNPNLIITSFDQTYILSTENGIPTWVVIPHELSDRLTISTDGSATTTDTLNDHLHNQKKMKTRGDVYDQAFFLSREIAYFNTYADKSNAVQLAENISSREYTYFQQMAELEQAANPGLTVIPQKPISPAIALDSYGNMTPVNVPTGAYGETTVLFKDSASGKWYALLENIKHPQTAGEAGVEYFTTLTNTFGTTKDIKVSVPLEDVGFINPDIK